MKDKRYTARQVTEAVLKKTHELLEKSELHKKYEGFKAVEESARESGASDPAAVAAAVGRKKYGKKAFQEAAAHGKKMGKAEEYKPENSKKENAKPTEHHSKDADQHAEGKAPKGEIHPKEHEEGKSDDVRRIPNPMSNPKEKAEGNNELAGTTPTQVGQNGKNMPGYDEMKGHLKLAKFMGMMQHKRSLKRS